MRGAAGGVERADAEHLAGAFAVAGRDDRRVHVEEAFLLEEVVDRAADAVAHPHDGAQRVGARPQVGPFAELLERVPLLLQRVRFGIAPAVDDQLGGVQLGGLLGAAGGLYLAAGGDAAAGREMLHFGLVVGQLRVGDDLDIRQARAVVQLQKAEAALGVAARADPALQRGCAADRRGLRASRTVSLSMAVVLVRPSGIQLTDRRLKRELQTLRREPALGIERGHAAGAGGGDGLAVVVVGHVAGGEYAFDARVACGTAQST